MVVFTHSLLLTNAHVRRSLKEALEGCCGRGDGIRRKLRCLIACAFEKLFRRSSFNFTQMDVLIYQQIGMIVVKVDRT